MSPGHHTSHDDLPTAIREKVSQFNDSRAEIQAMALRARLEHLERRMNERWPAVLGDLGPGLTDTEFDEIWASHDPGYPAAYEIRTWFTWHNGGGGAPWFALDLGQALQTSSGWPEVATQTPLTRWLPLFGESALSIVADCRPDHRSPTPLYFLSAEVGFIPTTVLSSFSDLVDTWHLCLDNNWWARDHQDWLRNEHLLPTVFHRHHQPYLPGVTF